MRPEDRDAVLALRVTEAQSPFVEPIEETLALTGIGRQNHVMVCGDEIAGFFQIETEDLRRFEGAPARELELHEVIVDVGWQGKGVGGYFIRSLSMYVRELYPDWETVSLSVNCRNDAAHALYLKGGFEDTGEIWPHGRSGPQYVLRLTL